MTQARILVVDDEPFNLDIVGEYLDEMDFDLVMVESGEAAWVRARAMQPSAPSGDGVARPESAKRCRPAS